LAGTSRGHLAYMGWSRLGHTRGSSCVRSFGGFSTGPAWGRQAIPRSVGAIPGAPKSEFWAPVLHRHYRGNHRGGTVPGLRGWGWAASAWERVGRMCSFSCCIYARTLQVGHRPHGVSARPGRCVHATLRLNAQRLAVHHCPRNSRRSGVSRYASSSAASYTVAAKGKLNVRPSGRDSSCGSRLRFAEPGANGEEIKDSLGTMREGP
jgi:hypothetical protein